MTGRIDLHLHTRHSDGVSSVAELLGMVRERRLQAFSITDHDTIDGYLEARAIHGQNEPELVPGVEFSCSSGSGDLHILAYLFDPENPQLREKLRSSKEQRNQRAHRIVQQLNRLGVDLDVEEVERVASGAPLGRPHIAQALYEQGATQTYEEAFARFIGDHGPAYVPKVNLSPAETIALIHRAHGLAILAHPVVDNAERHIDDLIHLDLDGLEVYHPNHRQSDVDRLKNLAARHRLVCSGGSDFHGRSRQKATVGSEPVPVTYLNEMKAKAAQLRGAT